MLQETTAPTPILSVQSLNIRLPKGADRTLAVEDVSFDVHSGEILCIVGESGSGKSMSSNAIMGLLPEPYVHISQGSILFEEQDLTLLNEREKQALRGQKLAMIFQEPMTALNPVMRVGAQLEEVFKAHSNLSSKDRHKAVVNLLTEVGLPTPELISKSYPFALSGGQRQRVMIAMALALEPKILIADEPTTALDVTTQAQILHLIKALQNKKEMGVIFITHDFGVVAEIADRVIVMQQGKIVEQGDAQQVLYQPQHSYTQQLIASVPQLKATHTQSEQTLSTVIEVVNLNKTYRTAGRKLSFNAAARQPRIVHAANQINFNITQGETLGLVGESGSGKSTVGRCIVGLHSSDSGQILFEGQNLLELDKQAQKTTRKSIQMIFQDPYASLNPRKNIGQIITEGPTIHGEPKNTAWANAAELLALVGLDASALKRYPHEFSGGQRQRIGIARALAMNPKLLIADEAVSALDVSVQAQVLELLDEIKQKMNLAMLFVTHDLRVAARICDHVAVMKLGEIVEYGRAEDIFTNAQHPYTQQLIQSIPGQSWDMTGIAPT